MCKWLLFRLSGDGGGRKSAVAASHPQRQRVAASDQSRAVAQHWSLHTKHTLARCSLTRNGCGRESAAAAAAASLWLCVRQRYALRATHAQTQRTTTAAAQIQHCAPMRATAANEFRRPTDSSFLPALAQCSLIVCVCLPARPSVCLSVSARC